MLQIGDYVKVHFMNNFQYREEIRTDNYGETFEIMPDCFGSPGILWNENNGLYLLNSFCYNVIFENVKTGELFHSVYNKVVPFDAEKFPDLLPSVSPAASGDA